MAAPACTHDEARKHLEAGDHEAALRIAGPLLEADPGDLTAWRFVALALAGLGEDEAALKNLGSIAQAEAAQGWPIQALDRVLELRDRGSEVAGLVDKIAASYGAGSNRLREAELAPPPLPAPQGVDPWDSGLAGGDLVSRSRDVMAMAWGNALTVKDSVRELPFVPLLSGLDREGFTALVSVLQRQVLPPGDEIVAQGDAGDAMYIVAAGEVAVERRSPSGEANELARLGPGAFFGEMALVSRAPRAATVRAVEQTVVLRADTAAMEEIAERSPTVGDVLIAFCHARMLENLVRVSPVLAPVTAARRPDVIARFTSDYRDEGEAIIQQGEPGDGLYLVVSGRVVVTTSDSGESMQLASLGPGDVFGEISLVLRKPSTASVTAVENTALLFLAAEQFSAVSAEFPELLKGAFDIAVAREEQNNSIMARQAAAADDLVLV